MNDLSDAIAEGIVQAVGRILAAILGVFLLVKFIIAGVLYLLWRIRRFVFAGLMWAAWGSLGILMWAIYAAFRFAVRG